MEIKFFRTTLFLCVCSLLLLTGCAFETDVTIYDNEAYVVKIDVEVNKMMAIPLGPGGAERQLDDIIQRLRQETGATASWKEVSSNDIEIDRYVINLEGNGFANALGEGSIPLVTPITYEGREAFLFEHTDIFDFKNQGIFFHQLTLRGGEILDSNGNQTAADSVTWADGNERLYAVFMPRSRYVAVGDGQISPWMIGAGVAGVALLGIGGLFVGRMLMANRMTGRRKVGGGYPATTTTKSCSRCRTRVSTGAIFCPKCRNLIR